MISIPDNLLERLDAQARANRETRSGFLQRVAERELDADERPFAGRRSSACSTLPRLPWAAMRPGSSGKTGNRTDVFLLDAGVWVAARDPEDDFHSAAREVVARLRASGRGPGSHLLRGCERDGQSQRAGREARYLLRTLETRCGDDVVAVSAQSIDAVLELAAEHGLTAYDAAYVAAAGRYGWVLVSTDVADLVSKGLAVTPDAADYP